MQSVRDAGPNAGSVANAEVGWSDLVDARDGVVSVAIWTTSANLSLALVPTLAASPTTNTATLKLDIPEPTLEHKC